jgi:hypothetical protein
VVVIAVAVVSLTSVVFIRTSERMESDQLLLLLCETGERNLDYYFNSVQDSVSKVSTFAEDDIKGLDTEQLKRHVEHMEDFFGTVANKTNGVLTYYYRIDPDGMKIFCIIFCRVDLFVFCEAVYGDVKFYSVFVAIFNRFGDSFSVKTDVVGAKLKKRTADIYCVGAEMHRRFKTFHISRGSKKFGSFH